MVMTGRGHGHHGSLPPPPATKDESLFLEKSDGAHRGGEVTPVE